MSAEAIKTVLRERLDELALNRDTVIDEVYSYEGVLEVLVDGVLYRVDVVKL